MVIEIEPGYRFHRDLPWPPVCVDWQCANPKCHATLYQSELNYIVYDHKTNKFVRLCPECYGRNP